MGSVEVSKPRNKLRLLLVEENTAGEDPTVWEMDYDGCALPGDPRHAPEKMQAWLTAHSMAACETRPVEQAELPELKRAREALEDSESRLAGIIESAMNAILSADAQQKIVMFNPAAEKMFRMAAADALGRDLSELIPARFRSAHANQVRAFGETNQTRRHVGGLDCIYCLRADGTEFPAEISISQTEVNGRKLFTAIVCDISERKKAEEALRLSEHCLRALVNASSDVIYRMSADWSEMRQLDGRGFIADTEAPSEDWLQTYIHPDDQALVTQTIQHSILNKSVFELEHRVRRTGGSLGWTLSRAVPSLDADGEILDWIGMASDVTRRKCAEEELRENHARLKKVLEVETVGVLFWDLTTGCLIDANDTFLNLMGYNRSDVEAGELSWQKLTPPEYLEVSRAELRKFATTGRVGPYEKEYFHKDGTRQWFVFAGSSLGGNSCVEFCVDISDRKRAQAALQESEQRLRLFIEYAPAALAMFDREMRYLQASRRWRADYGLGGRDLTGLCHYEVFPEVSERWKEVHRRGLAGEVLRSESDRFERADGSVQWIKWEIRPWYEIGGRIGGIVIFAEDITERKRAEEELSRKAEDLARSNQDLEQFAYVASHDLQEPLRMVSAYTQLLEERYRGQLDASADQYIGYAVEGATRMQALIQDLLAFSRVGRRGKERQTVDCRGVIAEAAQNLKAAIGEAGAVLSYGQLPMVFADRSQMVQLFQNLISNAIKFRGERSPAISVSAEQRLNGWVFAVADNGIGMAGQHCERIFEIFHRLHSRAEYPGNGIGLSICKKIVAQHGGRIWAESEVGKGSTFKFVLPAAQLATSVEERSKPAHASA